MCLLPATKSCAPASRQLRSIPSRRTSPHTSRRSLTRNIARHGTASWAGTSVGADCERVPCYSRQYLSDEFVMCMQGRMSLMRQSISSTSTWVRKLHLLNRQIPQQVPTMRLQRLSCHYTQWSVCRPSQVKWRFSCSSQDKIVHCSALGSGSAGGSILRRRCSAAISCTYVQLAGVT